MKTPNLLTDNDYNRILRAIQAHKEDALTITIGDYTINVSVVSVGKGVEVWGQPQLISVEEYYRNVFARKYCRSVEELKWYLRCRQRK